MEAGAAEVAAWLREAGLAGPGETPAIIPLSGGVSSDVFRVDLAAGPVCVKRALARLRVAAEWRAPVERSANEAAWLRAAADLGGPIVPRVLAEDPARHLFAMTWFDPVSHPVWKAELAAGRVDPAFAADVGRGLATAHARTAGVEPLARRFDTEALFADLRIDPYLRHAALRHPDLAERIEAIARDTLATRRALVHGDVSPKNILVGPDGPVLLDAECAWYGEPAFDIAFCANHLLLKRVWKPQLASGLSAAFGALVEAYLAGVDWEPPADLDRRAAALLSGLLLARVDGKSPVEYLTAEPDKALVRGAAREMLRRPPAGLSEAGAMFEHTTAQG